MTERGDTIAGAEARRLAALDICRPADGRGTADGGTADAYDRVVRLARRLFGVDTAAVILVDASHGRCLSSAGGCVLDLPRERSLCGYVVDTAGGLVVAEDLRADQRLAPRASLPENAGLGFYAGAPLRLSDGVVLGTLCLLDRRPRAFAAEDREALADLAALVVDALEARRAAAEAERLTAETAAVLDTAVDAIITIDERGIVQRANPATAQMFGYAVDELVGRNISRLMPVEHASKHDGYLSRYLQTGRGSIIGVGREVWGVRKDGSTFPSDMSVSEFTSGGRRFFAGILRDSTARHRYEAQLEASRERLSMAIENITDGFVLFDADGRIVLFNRRLLELYPVIAPHIEVGARFDDLIRTGAYEGQYADAIGREEEWVVERLDRHQGDEEVFEERLTGGRWIRVAERRMVNGWRVGVRADVTELRRAQQEAQDANRAKSEFLSNMSHELRTPLNAILGFAQLLQVSRSEPLSEKQNGYVEHILTGGHHLLELINEVLDLARIEAGRIDLAMEAVDPAPLIAECLDFTRGIADRKGITLETRCEYDAAMPLVSGDRTRLKQVLLNLLSNAVKYNRPQGSVTVGCGPHGPERLRVSVTDTGAGIPSDALSRLFEPFNRLGAESGGIEGTGIGLTISRRLMEAMGGAIGVHTKVGEGTTFWIDVPLYHDGGASEPAVPADRPEVPESLVDGRAARLILYVEDNAANIRLMEAIIDGRPDLTLIAAETAEVGLDLAQAHLPDVILMDVNLPGLDGVDALVQLRADPRTHHIPVIALSANAMESAVRRVCDAGFDDYLTKPVVIADLLRTLERVLTARQEDSE